MQKSSTAEGESNGFVEPNVTPTPNAIPSYWRSQPHALDEHRSTENLPSECDIVIIGAGISGVGTAYHLCANRPSNYNPTITILEARQVCSGATGRNGGHIKLKTTSMLHFIDKFGHTVAQTLADLVHEQIYAVKHIVEAENLDCDFELRRSYDVFMDRSDAEQARRKFQECLANLQPWTKDVRFMDKKQAQQVTSIKGVEAAFCVPACSFSPYKFVTGLLDRLIHREAINLQTNTPVVSVQRDDRTGYNLVHAQRGVIRAKKVVFASNGYTAGILKQYSQAITPCAATGASITPVSTKLPLFPCTYNFNYTASRVGYVNPRPDGSFVAGGGKWTYESDRSKWYNVWDDSIPLEGVEEYYRGSLGQLFAGWNSTTGSDTTTKVWTGIIGVTRDELPHIGEVPGSDGTQWIIAGFNGAGMLWIMQCAKGLAAMVTGDVASYRDANLPQIFQTTSQRL